ncbi:hypothetical protein SCLCIDRAFT_1141937 [Scleroderma citrinum Foug A]|uniref:Uncharacterized protein n=1 Tax=Scleroderma citrinum Foug A TaxID=1036808 RepID=A0A0C3DMU5_9AGAM|nr:hypothetical protein SCLCIDRAFT_1141937 [Scleroderma citrinum Foug A]
MSQAIFSVPGALHCITYVIAPINAFLNWCFGFTIKLDLAFQGHRSRRHSPSTLCIMYLFCMGTSSRIQLGSCSPELACGRNGEYSSCWRSRNHQIASGWWDWELTESLVQFHLPRMGVTASVRIGNLLGEGKARQAGFVVWTSIFMAVVIASIFRDPKVISLVAFIIPLLAIVQVYGTSTAVAWIPRVGALRPPWIGYRGKFAWLPLPS